MTASMERNDKDQNEGRSSCESKHTGMCVSFTVKSRWSQRHSNWNENHMDSFTWQCGNTQSNYTHVRIRLTCRHLMNVATHLRENHFNNTRVRGHTHKSSSCVFFLPTDCSFFCFFKETLQHCLAWKNNFFPFVPSFSDLRGRKISTWEKSSAAEINRTL